MRQITRLSVCLSRMGSLNYRKSIDAARRFCGIRGIDGFESRLEVIQCHFGTDR